MRTGDAMRAEVKGRSTRTWMRRMLLTMAGVVLLPAAAWGQGTTATLSGTVTDTSGAVIPNAAVELKNEKSGDTRSSKSNGSGLFSFSAVPVGDYDVTVKAGGFQSFQQTGIHLDPGDQKSVRDLALKAGTSDVVTVESAAQEITTDSGEQSSLISSEDIKHLSVEGRDVTELFKILPGFAISNGGGGNIDNQAYDPSQVSVTGALGHYAANGSPLNGISLLSDGADITDPGNFGGALQTVNYEQVAEVKTQTASFGADSARGPIVVNAVGKSGGNAFHGSLYTYARTSQLNSTDWLAKYTGQQKPPDRQVYPGFTFGGPVSIPGTRLHQDKLTFFVGAEQYAQRNIYAYGSASGATLTALVPTAGMRTGDFSAAQIAQYLGPQYLPAPNADGTTGPGCQSSSTTPASYTASNDPNICYVPQAGPQGQALSNGNIAPYIDPGTQLILNSMPLPNTASNGTYNWITTNLVQNNLWQAKGRIDYALSDKNKLFVVYSTQRGHNGVPQAEYYSPRGNLGGINVPGGGLKSTVISELGSLNLTTIISPTLTNELQLSGSYLDQNFVPVNFGATAGFPYAGLFNNGSRVFPTLEDYGNDGLPLSRLPDASYGGIFAKKFVRTGSDNVTKVLGQHTFRAGFFYQLDSNNQVTPFIATNGTVNQYYFPETFTDPVAGSIHNTGAVGSGSGGNYLANFLEGHVATYNQTNLQPKPNLFFANIDGYIQDHWRVKPHFTLDAGVRFEHLTPWGDAHGAGIPVFSAAAYAADVAAGVTKIASSLPGFRYHGIDKSVPVAGMATRWAFVEPRAGFAWDAYGTGATIVRAGGGVYRAHDSWNDASAGLGSVQGQRSATTQNILFSSIHTLQASATAGNGFVPYSNVTGFTANDDRQPATVTWNLAVDQKMPGNMFFEIAYVGNKSTSILNNGSTQNTNLDDLNALPIGSLFKAQPIGVQDGSGNPVTNGGTVYPLLPPFTAPNTSNPNNAYVGGLDQQHIDAFKPFPLYTRLQVAQHNLYANYHGLQTSLVKQQGRALFSVNYTFSKALGVLGGYSNGYPADPFNYRNDYQEESYDHRHIFNAAYSYTVGQVVRNKFIGGATNGWEVSGITNVQSGSNLPSISSPNFGIGGTLNLTGRVNPFTGQAATQSLGISNTNLLGTPDVNLQPTLLCDPRSHSGSKQYFNGSCFGLNPTLGVNGAYKFGFLPGPMFFDTDLTLAKTFKVTERQSVQFRAAAFNFINHANTSFTGTAPHELNLLLTSSSSGTVSQGLAGARSNYGDFGFANLKEGRRIMELALRYDF